MITVFALWLVLHASVQTGPQPDSTDVYYVVFLRPNPNRERLTSTDMDRIQAAHMANIRALSARGILVAAGPFDDTPLTISGIFIFRVGSIDEARRTAAEDPTVVEHRNLVDIVAWRGPRGIGVEYTRLHAERPDTPVGMGIQPFFLLYGDRPAAAPDTALQAHAEYLDRLRAAGTIGAAGPTEGDDHMAADPAVTSGALRAEPHRWWCAEHVLPGARLRYSQRHLHAFPLTRRSVLERIRSGDAEIRRAAFGTFAEGYWRPSYHYLRLRWHLSAEDAEDAVQAFFATAFEKRYLERFDPTTAHFRTFLRTCLDRFVQKDRQAAFAQKRGAAAPRLSLDFPGAERDLAAHLVASIADPDAFFRNETIRALCSRTVEAMREEFTSAGRARAFEVFARHDLADTGQSYASVANVLGLTVTQVTNDLRHARRLFRELALVELRALAATEDEFRSEARDLFGFEVAD